jgi:prepilin-type N-terminal cleavage/methylation domain-containing protein
MVKRATKQAEVLPAVQPPRRDRGLTFIEVLVAIVLLGTAVVAVLAATRATIIGSTTERDHAKAHQWLQSAIGVIEAIDFANCDSITVDGAEVEAVYDGAVNTDAERPEGFTGATIDVLTPKVWDGTRFVDFDTQSQCYDQFLLRQQLVEIVVTSPDGRIIENVEVVKRDQVSS